MKRILRDFLRRRAWLYLLVIFLAGTVDLLWLAHGNDAHGGFIFSGLFMLPLLLEQKQGCTGVVTTLPLSRRTAARYYWGVAVLLPVLAVAGAFMLAGLLSAVLFSGPPLAVLARSFAAVVLTTLMWAGAGGCIFTFFSPMARGETGYFMFSWTLLWAAALGLGVFIPDRFDLTKQGPAVWGGAVLLGILLPGMAFTRCEKLVSERASRRSRKARLAGLISGRIPASGPFMARFGGVYFKQICRSFLGSLLFFGIWLWFWPVKKQAGDHVDLWGYMFLLGVMPSTGILSGGPRVLRSLPFSAGQLALILLFLPLASFLAILAALGVMQGLHFPHFIGRDSPAFLIPMAGVICVASSFAIRFYNWGYAIMIVLCAPAAEILSETVLNVKFPAVFWCALGAGLMTAAFFLNRSWLRSSAAYRRSSVDVFGWRI